jgi:hypothetical protein
MVTYVTVIVLDNYVSQMTNQADWHSYNDLDSHS